MAVPLSGREQDWGACTGETPQVLIAFTSSRSHLPQTAPCSDGDPQRSPAAGMKDPSASSFQAMQTNPSTSKALKPSKPFREEMRFPARAEAPVLPGFPPASSSSHVCLSLAWALLARTHQAHFHTQHSPSSPPSLCQHPQRSVPRQRGL